MKKILVTVSFALCASAPAFNIANAENMNQVPHSMELTEAYDVIQNYRELRESCAVGTYDQRRECVNVLSKASEKYREAKDVIAEHKISARDKSIASFN